MSSIPLSHNPQSQFNGFISLQRTSILISSVGITMYTLSRFNKKYKKDILIICICLLLLSIIYSFNTSYNLHNYIKFLKSDTNLKPPYTFLIKDWQKWIILSNVYSGILIIVMFFILFVKILKIA